MRLFVICIVSAFVAAFLMTGTNPFYLLHRVVLTQNIGYADYVFSDVLPVDQVLSSIHFRSSDPLERVCSVAVVSVKPSSADVPPDLDLKLRDLLGFGGTWRATPEILRRTGNSDLLQVCRKYIDGGTLQTLQTALREPGAFVIVDWKNDVMLIYAPLIGLAAYLSHRVVR
ncbi:MAG: hypothetical protein NTW20_14570 [Rhodobacterales bacterium]|nr:hypothetical protein [Rhodobacterales bacterium]